MSKRKMVWIVVLILAVIVALFMLMNGRDEYVLEHTPTPTPLAKAVKKISMLPKSGTAQQTLAYSDIVKQYVGRQIQFDINCQAIPTQTTFKTGTAVMFDNRSGDARTIKISDVVYSFPGYGYKILTLSNSTLPKTLNLNCGAAVNVGSILLQR